MEQTVNNAVPEKDAPERAAAPPPARNEDLKLVGRFSRYTSVFWQIVLPFLSARYLFEGSNILFDFSHKIRHWGKPPDANELAARQKILAERQSERLFGRFGNQGAMRWLVSNIGAISFGTAIAAIAAFYTSRTYKDIKALFAEAVGYELDKDPSQVKFRDMKGSKNVIVKTTMHSLVNRTLKRFGAISTFFIPWGPLFAPGKYHNTKDQLDDIGLKMGTGIVGFYLFTDGFLRKQSLFEAMQEKLGDPTATINAADIEYFLNLDKKSESKDYVPPVPGTEAATQQAQLATLIADRMNHTYKVNPPDALFTIGKLVYMLGFDMLNNYPENLGYVELASKSQGMKEVKEAAAAIKNGQDPEAVFRGYGITLPATVPHTQQAPAPEQAAGKYTNLVGQPQIKMPQAARTPQDFAATPENTNPSLRM